MIHVPMDEDAGLDLGAGILVTGSADCTARSWSVDSGLCLKVINFYISRKRHVID